MPKVECGYCHEMVDEETTIIIGDLPACAGCQDRQEKTYEST